MPILVLFKTLLSFGSSLFIALKASYLAIEPVNLDRYLKASPISLIGLASFFQLEVALVRRLFIVLSCLVGSFFLIEAFSLASEPV